MTEGGSEKGARRPRRRPGRFRRWVVRPVVWLLAGAVLVLALGALVLESPWVEERGRRWLEGRLGRLLDREVRIEGLDFELMPLAIELSDVVVGGSQPGEAAFVEVERLLVEARSLRWGSRELDVGRILLERPVVRLIFHEEGGSNIPLRGRQRGERRVSSLRLSVAEFTVREGALEIDHRRLPLSVAGRQLRADLTGGDGLEASGRVAAREVELLLPRGRPYLGAIEAQLALDAEGLRILGGRVVGPSLEARLAGDWSWRSERVLSLDLEGRAEANLFDELGYNSGEVSGPFRFDLGFAWRPQLWGYRGSVESDRLNIFGRVLTSVVAEVAGDRNAIHLDVARAGYAGGGATGRVAYRYGEEDRPFEIDLVLEDARLSTLLVDQRVPLAGVEALVDGPFSYAFPIREPRRGSGRARLRLDRPGDRTDALPLSGSVPLVFERGVLRSAAIQVASEAQRFLASGEYDLSLGRGGFDLEVTSDRVDELLPLLPIPAERRQGAPWAPSAGRGVVAAALTLAPGSVSAQVQLDLEDVSTPGAAADEVNGTFSVDAAGVRDLRLELTRPSAAVIVQGSLPFGEGPEAAFDLSLAVEAAGWPYADASVWVPFELPLEGAISGSLVMEGSLALTGHLDARLASGSVAGVEVAALDVDLEFDPETVRFLAVDATTAAGVAHATGELELESGLLALDFDAGPLDLSEPPLGDLLPELEPPPAGRLAASGRFTGTLERPRLEAELVWSAVTLGPAVFAEPARTRLDWDGERLEVGGSLPGLDSIAGGGRLDREAVAVELRVASDDLSALLSALAPDGETDLTGALAGVVTLEGRFDDDFAPSLDVRLDRLDLARGSLALEAAEPVVARLGAAALEIESLFLTTTDLTNELFVAGRVGFAGDGELALTAQSSLDSAWLEPFLPEVDLRAGRFDLLASIGGTMEAPDFNGVGRLSDASALIEGLSIAVEELGGVVLLYPGRVVLDSVAARTAGGRIQGEGSIVLPDGSAPPSYQFNLAATDLSLSYPEGWQLVGDARVSLVSTEAGRALRGEVDLERAYYTEPIRLGFESALRSLFQRRRVLVAETSELKSTTALNLTIRGRDALRVRNNLASVAGDIDFTLRGSLAAPVLFGSVTLEPGGTLVYAGNDYEIERGELNFANPYRIDPILDLQATTDLREYDVRLNLSGSPDRLEVGVSSNPPLPELEVLALLTGGRAPGRLGLPTVGETDPALGVEGFLAGEAASVVTDRVNRLFGLDRLRVSPLTGTSGDLSSARVTLGERISRDLFATYSFDPSTSEEQILELEWSVSPRLLVVLTQNGDASYAVDLRWETSF